MKRYCCWRPLCGALIALCVSGGALAADAGAAWKTWLLHQVEQHPQVAAAREKMHAALARADGRERPLYNPELETEYEREGDGDNVRLGFNQTVDWWGKRDVRRGQSAFIRLAARQAYAQTLQDQAAEAMRALVQLSAAAERHRLASQQETQLDTLVQLVRERQKAGDLGRIDVELTLLSLSQILSGTARAAAAYKTAQIRVRERLPAWTPATGVIPDPLWQLDIATADSAWLDAHPKVLAARARLDAEQKAAELARLEAKADPTFGLNAGREGEEDIVGLRFSIPLNIRNNHSADRQAANREALAAEARYRAVRRQQRFQIEAAGEVAREYRQQMQRWQALMRESREQSGKLLAKQWHTGDLGTAEYLLAMQQRLQGLQAGIELREHYRLALIDWLHETGQVTPFLTRPAQ